ncbi:M48 family metalloprotease [Paraglaciecola agarilytica]|uniref:beta-barrel assembly-enhancing protease n=1 Tax=Paraglaciecola chathamensis TaxID=368405 RepID=UPI001C082ED6|nr:M48 family metalloprotease [Paraglaciecola agarilytica]MBU3016557.1 M48 family metalloprotease [Paraglaciecola agarilytica]
MIKTSPVYKKALLSTVLAFGIVTSGVGLAANQKNALPEIGVVASSAISLDKEIQIGDVLMRQLRGQAPIINDPLLDEYIQDLGNRLVAQADNVKFPFEFFLLNSADINAFAFFGGHVGVHTGLIYNARNESELASVLAHEVSHVTQRHIARSIAAQQKSSPLQLASALGGILLALANPEAGIAAISAGSAASAQASINYTRQNEKEADSIGIRILAQAGFDPNGASDFFGTLVEKYRLKSRTPAFLLTHPLPESRVADARTRAASYKTGRIAPSLSFHLAKSRILARYYATPEYNINYFETSLERGSYTFKAAAEYGLALAYLADKQNEKAGDLIDSLLQKDPRNLFYLDTYTDVALETGRVQDAIDKLTAQAVLTPRNRVITLNLANALVKNKEFDQAVRLLKDYLLVEPENMLAHQILSDAYAESQNKLEMHQTKAEVYALAASYPRAIDELHSAYNYAGTQNIEKQRIRARIEQFRAFQTRLESL